MSIFEQLQEMNNNNNEGVVNMERLTNNIGEALKVVVGTHSDEETITVVEKDLAVKAQKEAEEKAANILAAKRATNAKHRAERKEEQAKQKTINAINTVTTITKMINNSAKVNSKHNNNYAVANSLSGKKVANILELNKNRMTVKNQTNILNIFFGGYSVEKDVDLDPSAVSYIQTMESELLRLLKTISPLIDERRFVGDRNMHQFNLVKNIQDELVVLTIDSDDSVSKNMYRIFVTEDEVYIRMDEGDLVGIISNERYTLDVLKDKTFKVYEGLLYSPSQEKKDSITAFKTFEGILKDYNEDAIKTGEDRVINYLDIATSGMLSILKKKGELTFKKAVKCNARLSQIMAPSEVLGICQSYVLIMHKDKMMAYDGGCYYRALSVNNWLKKGYFGGFALPEAASAGSTKQFRALGTKTAGVGARDRFINTELSKFNVVELKRDEITPEIQEQLELGFSDKGIQGKFAPVTLTMIDGQICKYDATTDLNTPYEVDETIKQDIIDSFNGHGRFDVDNNGRLELITAVKISDEYGIDVPDFVCDLNCFKAAVDFRTAAKFVMLDSSKGFSGTGKLSIQMALTLLLNGKDGIEYLRKTMLQNINDSFDKLMDPSSTTPTIEDFNEDNFFLTNLMNTAAKDFVLKYDAPAFRTMANHWLKGQCGNIQRFNVLTKHSGFARLIADPTLLLGGFNLLEDGDGVNKLPEVYSEDVNKEYDAMEFDMIKDIITTQPETDKNRITKKMLIKANSIDDIKVTTDEKTLELINKYIEFKKAPRVCIVFRSPKMGLAEFLRARCVTKKELTARLKAKIKDVELAETLIEFFTDIKPGTFVLPAYEKYKALLGGADFDFDGVTVIADLDFIKAMKGIQPKIVKVGDMNADNKGKKKEETYKLGDFVSTFKMFMKQIFSGNMGIGQITNMNDLICLLLFVDDDTVRKLLKKNFECSGKEVYTSPIEVDTDSVTHMNVITASEVVARIRRAKLSTHQEIVNIIFDLNDVLRGYQEGTIDASKSGDVIDVLFNLLQDCTLLCLTDKADVTIDWREKRVANNVNRKDTTSYVLKKGPRKGKLAFIINDEFHKIMVEAYDLLETKANELVQHSATMSLTDEHLSFLTSVHNKYSEYDESLLWIRSRYNETNGARIDDTEKLKDKDGNIKKLARKVVLPEISKTYNNTTTGLTNMTRSLLKDLSPLERAALLKYTAIYTKEDDADKEDNKRIFLNKEGGSSICHTLLPEEYLLLVMELDKQVSKVAKSKVYGAGRYKDGEMVTIINGISVEENSNIPSLIGSKDITGTFKIEKDEDGTAYLVDDIENLINIKIPEKRVVVLKLAPKVRGQYKSLITTLQDERPKAVKLTAWSKKCSYDKVEVITDGIIKPLSKFVAPSGSSPLGKVMDGFVGNVCSINIHKGEYENKYGEKKSYHTILVVAEEAEVEFKKDTTAMDRLNSIGSQVDKEAAVDKTTASTSTNNSLFNSLEDLRASFKSEDTKPEVVTPVATVDPSTTLLKDFGGYEDVDVVNFLKSLQ